MSKPILLSIDLDFFSFEDPYWDLAHREGMLPEVLWAIRLMSTAMSGINLVKETSFDKADFHPLKTLEVLREAGWQVSSDCKISLSDSHMYAFPAWDSLTNCRIVNFDAHHDLGYASRQDMRKRWKSKRIQCEDWLWFYLRRHVHTDAVNIFPSWKPGGDWPDHPHWDGSSVGRRVRGAQFSHELLEALAGEVVAIHIARSDAWLPPWHDWVVPAMVGDMARESRWQEGRIRVFGDTDPTEPRDFDVERHLKLNEVRERRLRALMKHQHQVSSP